MELQLLNSINILHSSPLSYAVPTWLFKLLQKCPNDEITHMFNESFPFQELFFFNEINQLSVHTHFFFLWNSFVYYLTGTLLLVVTGTLLYPFLRVYNPKSGASEVPSLSEGTCAHQVMLSLVWQAMSCHEPQATES